MAGLLHAVGSWLFGLRLIATAAWQGQKAWAVGLWKANPVRVVITVLVVFQLGCCAGKAFGAQPPAGAVRLAYEFARYTPTSDMTVVLCVANTSNCTAKTVLWKAGVSVECTWVAFQPEDPQPGAAKECKGVPVTSVAKPFVVCNIDWSADIRQRVRYHQPVPAEAGGGLYAVWPCEGKKAQAQWYTLEEFQALVDHLKNPLNWLTLNEWVASQPVAQYSASRAAFLKAKADEHAALLWPPAPPAGVASGATDRPVYRLKADGSRNTTAVSGVRVVPGTPCNPDKRPAINPGNYMSVEGQLDTQGRVMGDVYAVCALTGQ
jgi:hypothetical protein